MATPTPPNQSTEASGDAAATAAADAAKAAAEKAEAKASKEPIESVAVRAFYTDENKFVAEGERYFYYTVEDQPYPWANIRPVDQSLHKSLEAEFRQFKKDKMRRLEDKDSLRAALSRIGEEA